MIMKEKIQQINQTVKEKGERLKEKVERNFSVVVIPSSVPTSIKHASTTQKIPPISYILYGVAGLSMIGVFSSDSKILCALLAAASAYGGYKLSKNNIPETNSQHINQYASVDSQKNEITTKVIDIVKKITKEWEEFMEYKQKEIQQTISLSDCSSSQKDEMTSKIFLYEVIDINLLEFSDALTNATSPSEINTKVEAYKKKLLSAIDSAVAKQVAKYDSL